MALISRRVGVQLQQIRSSWCNALCFADVIQCCNMLYCIATLLYGIAVLLCCSCGEFDNAGAMMSIDDLLMCSFQILKPAEKQLGPNSGSQHH